mmetsp:Transcript_4360/g.9442  ORF Transcript_4360/g.9442 Transcript_4360/m.9442 type:complete len:105 (-) Transcript_4360:462-776(-)
MQPRKRPSSSWYYPPAGAVLRPATCENFKHKIVVWGAAHPCSLLAASAVSEGEGGGSSGGSGTLCGVPRQQARWVRRGTPHKGGGEGSGEGGGGEGGSEDGGEG